MVITPIRPLEPMTGTAHELSALTARASPLTGAQLGLCSMSSSTTTCSPADARPTGLWPEPNGTSAHDAGRVDGKPRVAAHRRTSPSLRWTDKHLLFRAAPREDNMTDR